MGKYENRIPSIIKGKDMIKRDYVEFTDVQKNYECRLLIPSGMQLQDAFDCSIRMVQALGHAIKENQQKEKEQKDGGENETTEA